MAINDARLSGPQHGFGLFKRSFSILTALFALGLHVGLTLAIAAIATYSLGTLPGPWQIQSMNAEVYGRDNDSTFSVPAKHFAALLAAFRPAVMDWSPSKWVVVGELLITTDNGKRIRVGLYRTRAAIGAFSIESENPQSSGRQYYRGGTDNAMKHALISAQKDAG